MQGQSDGSQVEPLERSRVYTATGDAIVRTNYKDPLLGQVLENKYRILEVIGWGGMSVVYKARHVLVDRLVAIKTVKFRPDERPDVWQRFQREIITLSRLSHPNVVTVYDCIVGHDGQPYVVMDHIQGCTLDDILQSAGRLQLRRLCSIASQVASAVEHAHRHNVIHRDLKPANIMILGEDEQFEVKVVDFGLAKLGEDDQRLTQTGQLWGSPPYISPEQIKGGTVDHRCDIYSLGVVVYEMACGRDPFASDVVYEMLHHHLHRDPPPFAEVCPSSPPPRELEAVVRKAMAKNPNDRYQSMADFKEDIEKACLTAERRMAAEVARNPQSATRATTGRLTSMGKPVPALPASNRSTRSYSDLSLPRIAPANFLYMGLTALMVFAAAVVGTNRSVFQGFKPQLQSEITAERRPYKPNTAKSPGRTPTPQVSSAAVKPSPVPLPVRLTVRQHSLTAAKVRPAAVHTHLTSSAAALPVQRPTPAKTPSVKNSLPNASKLHVDQSKFQLLRDLKSPILRQECGDLPQQ
ncbi:MAG: protein kinase [Cyanobacteria bacterium SZAS LIN-3]|nr:protein kinase [Cyanobacteria bacterium SZAS LIN-3]